MKTKWKTVSPYTGMEEDAPANAAGPTTGGNIAGLGTGPQGGYYIEAGAGHLFGLAIIVRGKRRRWRDGLPGCADRTGASVFGARRVGRATESSSHGLE